MSPEKTLLRGWFKVYNWAVKIQGEIEDLDYDYQFGLLFKVDVNSLEWQRQEVRKMRALIAFGEATRGQVTIEKMCYEHGRRKVCKISSHA